MRTLAFALLLTIALARAQTPIEVQYLSTILGDSSSAVRLANPLGMSLDLEDNIYIADTGNHRLLKCTLQGKLVREVGGFGFGAQQFDRPVDVWVDNSLNVFVADYNNQRLQRYDKDLNFISSYASDATLDEDLRFGYPAALALSAQGELFVAEHEFNRVLRFDDFGRPKASFGDFNWGEGGLERPAKIFVTGRGEVWVSDSLRHALILYDAFGNYVRSLQTGKQTAPSGMAEWPHGMIVTARRQHALLFFNGASERVGEFGKRGQGVREFDAPAAVALLRAGAVSADKNVAGTARILVLDSGNNRVQLFEIKWKP